MVEINEVYGGDYQRQSLESKINTLVNNMANNIANEQYRFRLQDTTDLWNANRMKQFVIDRLIGRISSTNKNLYIANINANTDEINMIPVLIANSPVEYFYIIDQEKSRAYFLYITPEEVNTY